MLENKDGTRTIEMILKSTVLVPIQMTKRFINQYTSLRLWDAYLIFLGFAHAHGYVFLDFSKLLM